VQYQDSGDGERSYCAQINQEEHDLEAAADLCGVRWARRCMQHAHAAHQLYGLELEGHRHSDVALIMSARRG